MNPVQFGEATSPQTPSPVISRQTPSSPPADPEPVEEQPPIKHFNWPWHKWVLLAVAVVIFYLAVMYLANRPQLLNY